MSWKKKKLKTSSKTESTTNSFVCNCTFNLQVNKIAELERTILKRKNNLEKRTSFWNGLKRKLQRFFQQIWLSIEKKSKKNLKIKLQNTSTDTQQNSNAIDLVHNLQMPI